MWADRAMKTDIEGRSIFDRLWLNAKSIKDEARTSLQKIKTTKKLRIEVVETRRFCNGKRYLRECLVLQRGAELYV